MGQLGLTNAAIEKALDRDALPVQARPEQGLWNTA